MMPVEGADQLREAADVYGPDSPEAALAARIREYSDMFGTAYHAHDTSLMRPYCHLPSMMIGGGGVRLMLVPEDIDATWARAHEPLRVEDYGHSVLHTVDVTTMSPSTALVSVECSRYRQNGEEFQRFLASYIVLNGENGWQITTWLGRR